jgi:hypothetical protein
LNFAKAHASQVRNLKSILLKVKGRDSRESKGLLVNDGKPSAENRFRFKHKLFLPFSESTSYDVPAPTSVSAAAEDTSSITAADNLEKDLSVSEKDVETATAVSPAPEEEDTEVPRDNDSSEDLSGAICMLFFFFCNSLTVGF